MENAPSVLDSLDDICHAHFTEMTGLLDAFGVPYVVDRKIVRGLDYYSGTVFEFIAPGRASIGGGGRYDGLIQQVGGNPTPGIGFGMGMERLIMLLTEQNLLPDLHPAPAIFIGHTGAAGFAKSHEMVNTLRLSGILAENDLLNRSVKAQMKYADKIKARHCLIIGDSELQSQSGQIKDMATGESVEVAFSALVNTLTIHPK
jgi:histidyl-tRNA synthetase